MESTTKTRSANPNRSLIASVVAGILASVCCVGPFVLLALGVSGAWISTLTVLQPYQPIFIGITLLFLGLAFRKLYLVPQVCEPGTSCANPATRRNQRIAFWAVTVFVLGLIGFTWYGPLLIG
jgi:mercuric ion transport protein